MRVLSVPRSIRAAAFLALAFIPLAGFQLMIYRHAPWWNPPVREVLLAAGIAAAILIPHLIAVTHNPTGSRSGSQRAFRSLEVWAALWICGSIWLTLKHGDPAFSFVTAFLAVSWLVLLYWLRHEMSRPYFDPNLKWYQGRPRPIPNLACRFNQAVGADSEDLEFKVTRFDQSGAFLLKGNRPVEITSKGSAELEFRYRDRSVSCLGVPVRALEADDGELIGAGVRFDQLTADSRKEIGDFVELLRGEGHI